MSNTCCGVAWTIDLGRWTAAVPASHDRTAPDRRRRAALQRVSSFDAIDATVSSRWELVDLGVEIAVRVVIIRQPDDLDAAGGLRDHALRVGHRRVVGCLGVDVEIGGERAVRRPRALEWDRELDAPAIGGEVDLALPAFVLDAAPRPHLVAAVRNPRRRHARVVTDRHLGDAVREHEAVPRAEHAGCDRAGRRYPGACRRDRACRCAAARRPDRTAAPVRRPVCLRR